MTLRRIIRLAALALAIAAITASTAAARPAVYSPSYPSHAAAQPAFSSHPAPAADGFHWGDAGLGAVLIAPVLLVVVSAVYLRQRRHSPGHRQPRSIG